MKEKLTIPKEINKAFGPDYEKLRKKGLEYIEELTSKIWTDYNTHDPGITTLELLCYTLTDLGYRIAMPIEDILAAKKDNKKIMHEHFLTALEILPCAPVSKYDYRKLFVRIDGVKNAWLEIADHYIIANYSKQPPELRYALSGESATPNKELKFKLQGINNILIEYEEIKGTTPSEIAFKKLEVIQKIKKVYHHFRNLCEDSDEVKEVPVQKISICAEIELDAKSDPEKVWADIIYAIELYLSPEVNFYTLQEMFEKGKSPDEIFEGPVFDFSNLVITNDPVEDKKIFSKKGFIDHDEIVNSALKEEVRLSDLINIIMKIKGVKVVKNIFLDFCQPCSSMNDNYEPSYDKDIWHICVKKGHKPVLSKDKTVINFFKDVVPIELKKDEALQNLVVLKEKNKTDQTKAEIEDIPVPTGQYRSIENYETFQNNYPETYGVGQVGLPENATTKRKSLAKQMKAYLLFFDQVLANYFSQLANVRTLLSSEQELKKSYFNNAVSSLKDDSSIYAKHDNWEGSIDYIFKQAKLDNYVERKNKFLDHLLARFAEQFNEYVFLLFQMYQHDFDYSIIRHKASFYNDYTNISTYRADALDYFNKKSPAESLINVSGLEKRLSRMLGFANYKRQKISNLPFQIVKVSPADPLSKYTWFLDKGTETILQGTSNSIKEVDAYLEMSMAIVLGSDREFYKLSLSGGNTKVSFSILNSKGTSLALSNKQYNVLPGELDTGVYSETETAIAEIITYFRDELKIEGLHVVEHILLRPDFDRTSIPHEQFLPVCISSNGDYCEPLDAYSFRIAVILPGYTFRLRNIDFRRHVERVIREETPAHILPRICFVSQEHMKEFEDLYELWLNTRIQSSNPEKQVPDALNKQFTDLLEKLFTIYPEGELADCDDDTDETNPIILGKSQLGTLENESDTDA